MTDPRFTDANRRVLAALLVGVDQLFIESVFLDAELRSAWSGATAAEPPGAPGAGDAEDPRPWTRARL